MTLDQIRNAIWKGTGELPDIDPSVDSTELTRVANLGQLRVATWKDPASGRINKFHKTIGDVNFRSSVKTDVVTAVSNSTSPYYLDLTSVDANDDQYNDWCVEITSGDADGEVRYITDYDGANLRIYLDDSFSSTPAIADTCSLYKNFFYLMPSTHSWVADHISLPSSSDSSRATGNLIEPIKITDISNNRNLRHSKRGNNFPENLYASGDATEWYRNGNKVFFNYNISTDDVWYKMEYYRTPTDMVNDSDEPELPAQFHYAIVVWGLEYYYREGMENSSKYSEGLDFDKYMRSIVSEYDFTGFRESKRLRMNY